MIYDYEQTSSTHRIIREKNPGGRILENDYDPQGRVIAQRARVGENSVLGKNTEFQYFVTQESGKIITGFNLVKDAYNQETLYEYTNGLITKITDPLGKTIHREWYRVGETNFGVYPRILKKHTDKRGLVTEFKYNTKGNVIERTTIRDITGDGESDTATTKLAYNDKNLLTSVIDPMGNEVAVFYEDSNHPGLPTRIERRFQGQVGSTSAIPIQPRVVSKDRP